jgi:hypothetical protein
MRTLGKFLAPFALFVSLVLSLSAWGHKPKVKKGAFALVEKAYAVSNLQDSGLPPFKALTTVGGMARESLAIVGSGCHKRNGASKVPTGNLN